MASRLARPGEPPFVVGNPLPSILSVALVTAVLGGLLAWQADWSGTAVLAGLAGYAIVSCIVVLMASPARGRAGFGIANQVTLVRAGLVCLAGGAVLAGGPPSPLAWSLVTVVAAALSLDAVDGWLARRFGLSSGFGARFDLEIDALLILILALLVWQSGRVGPWVLVIGLMRYAFVAAGWLLPGLRRPLPPSRRRQTVCVQQGVTLLLCLLPPVGGLLASVAAGAALLALLASFAVDLIYLVRTGGETASIDAVERRADRFILLSTPDAS